MPALAELCRSNLDSRLLLRLRPLLGLGPGSGPGSGRPVSIRVLARADL